MGKLISDVVKKIETSFEVNQIEYDGICLWPYIRYYIFDFYQNKNSDKSKKYGTKNNRLKKYGKYVYQVVSGIIHSSFTLFHNCNSIILFTATNSAKKIDGRIVDRILEGVINYLGESILPVVISTDDGNKTEFNKCLYFSVIQFSALIRSFFVKIDREKIKGIDIYKSVISTLNISDINLYGIIKFVVASSGIFKKLFIKTNAKMVVLTCYYDICKMSAIRAAKELGIPVIELQHGTIGTQHIAYQVFRQIEDNPFPDYFFCYGEKFKKYISPKFITGNHIFITGSYYLEEMLKRRNDNIKLFEKKYGGQQKITIVIASQDNRDQIMLDFSCRIAKLNKNIRIIFIPRYLRGYHKNIKIDNLFIEYELDIYKCMQNADVTITVNSTCAYESLYLGTPLILYDISGAASETFEEQFNGFRSVRYVTTPESAVAMVEELRLLDCNVVMDEASGFFAYNHSDLIRKAFDAIDSG